VAGVDTNRILPRQVRLGVAKQSIEGLEDILKGDPELTARRLELGSLYLWVGKLEAARAQYKILNDSNPASNSR